MRPDVLSFVRDSVTDPRDAARRLLALGLPRRTVLEGAALISALGALLVSLASGGTLSLPMGPGGAELEVGPIPYALALVASLFVSAAAIHYAGRALGGAGTFDDALLIIVWMEAVALAVQVVQLLCVVALPFAAPLIGLAGLVLLLWCLLNFVQVLHGFPGLGRPALTLVLGGVAMGIAVTLFLGLAGGGGDV